MMFTGVTEIQSYLSLDVGCGESKRGTIGIDYMAKSNVDVIADAHFLPFKNGVFDKVVSFTVLEHSPNPLNFLKEQYHVLKKNGELMVETDNAQYFGWTVLGRAVGGRDHANILEDHYAIFFPENVHRLLNLAGFRITGFTYLNECTSRIGACLARFFVRVGFWREACLFMRFRFNARKS
jgi:SAM-dependent methyltransferase